MVRMLLRSYRLICLLAAKLKGEESARDEPHTDKVHGLRWVDFPGFFFKGFWSFDSRL